MISQEQKRSRQGQKRSRKAKNDLARPSTISQGHGSWEISFLKLSIFSARTRIILQRHQKAKNDLARPKTISVRPKTISQGQKRSRPGQKRSRKAKNDLAKPSTISQGHGSCEKSFLKLSIFSACKIKTYLLPLKENRIQMRLQKDQTIFVCFGRIRIAHQTKREL